MITPTAISIMFPRRAKVLNSSINFFITRILSFVSQMHINERNYYRAGKDNFSINIRKNILDSLHGTGGSMKDADRKRDMKKRPFSQSKNP